MRNLGLKAKSCRRLPVRCILSVEGLQRLAFFLYFSVEQVEEEETQPAPIL